MRKSRKITLPNFEIYSDVTGIKDCAIGMRYTYGLME